MNLKWLFQRGKSEEQPKPAQQAAPVQPPAPKPEKIYLPKRLDGIPLAYSFADVKFAPACEAPVYTGYEEIVTATVNGDTVELTDGPILFGRIKSDKIRGMLEDWTKDGNPYRVILKDPGDHVTIGFYRDKRVAAAYREQTVVALTAYSGEKKQETIAFLENGDEVDLEEDGDHDDAVIVTYEGDPIGNLPKSAARRHLEEGAYAAFFEKVEEDDNYREKPFVRIYW